MPELDRRRFLKLVGVSAGGVAASGCSDHVEKLIPYVVQPEEITPGIAVHYASTCRECPAGCGLHVRTREGRPVKLEGNPEHPVNRGALCARGQAGIGRTYHPDRFPGPMVRQSDGRFEAASWETATAMLAEKLGAAGGRARVFGGPVGPTLADLVGRFSGAVGAPAPVVYEPFAHEALRSAAQAVFGVESRPGFDLSDTDYVIDFGADSLDAWLSPVEHQRQLKQARNVATEEGRSARFVYVGPRLSNTASNADEWLPAVPGSEGLLALGIARAAFEERQARSLPVGGDPALIRGVLRGFEPEAVQERTGIPAETIRRIGREIGAARRAVALPPGVAATGRRATATAAAVLLLDAVVGAVGQGVVLTPSGSQAPASLREVAKFVDSMKAGEVDVLLVHDANPVYSLPPDLGFAEALGQVGFVVAFASLPDETTRHAHLILPDHTTLESWGDYEPRPGVRSIVQPTLRPLFDTQALGDTLLQTARAMGPEVGAQLPAGSFRQVLEAAWGGTDWRAALARGGVFAPAAPVGASVAPSLARVEFKEPPLEGEGDWVLVPNPSPLLYDGRGAALPWLQETPDPVTKVAWTSWAEISRKTAEKLGVGEGDVVAVETSFGRAEVPVFPRGGIRDDVVAVAIGQGHRVGRWAGQVEGESEEARGVNVIGLLPTLTDENGGRAWLTTRAKLAPTGAHRRLPNTQRSDNKRGRQLGEAISLATLAGGAWNAGAFGPSGGHVERDHGGGVPPKPAAAGHGEGHGGEHAAAAAAAHGGAHHEGFHEQLRPYDAARDAVDASPYRWGMTVDLDRCSGCSACVVACSIENNVPNVGEEGVLRNRQMHWLRIERYVGEGEQELIPGRKRPDDREALGQVDVRHSPMLCQQCGAAPCEPVCPVLATYHTEEGLNAMIYNRCIGTRYCSNNCPYKVRRFNWFDYAIHNWPAPMQYMLNPDVTVRGQGVMEKCTFCVQRIQEARQTAKDQKRPIADGEVTPACAQTCPSGAIVFGNLRDDGSRANKLADENRGRAYHALQVLNTRPGVTYLAKVIRDEGEDHG